MREERNLFSFRSPSFYRQAAPEEGNEESFLPSLSLPFTVKLFQLFLGEEGGGREKSAPPPDVRACEFLPGKQTMKRAREWWGGRDTLGYRPPMAKAEEGGREAALVPGSGGEVGRPDRPAPPASRAIWPRGRIFQKRGGEWAVTAGYWEKEGRERHG